MRTDQFPKVYPRSKFSAVLANKIIKKLLSGKSLQETCNDLNLSYRTVFSWIARGNIPESEITHKTKQFFEFRAEYLNAKEAQSEDIYEQIEAIERQVEDGTLTPSQGQVLIKSKRWRATQMDLKRYGKRQTIEGKTKVVHEIKVVKEMIEPRPVEQITDDRTEPQVH